MPSRVLTDQHIMEPQVRNTRQMAATVRLKKLSHIGHGKLVIMTFNQQGYFHTIQKVPSQHLESKIESTFCSVC